MIRLICVKGKYIYGLSETKITTEEFGKVVTYGIIITGENNSACVKDISNSFNFVYNLFELIVEEELYPEHLQDVVEDYLSSSSNIIPFIIGQQSPNIA